MEVESSVCLLGLWLLMVVLVVVGEYDVNGWVFRLFGVGFLMEEVSVGCGVEF